MPKPPETPSWDSLEEEWFGETAEKRRADAQRRLDEAKRRLDEAKRRDAEEESRAAEIQTKEAERRHQETLRGRVRWIRTTLEEDLRAGRRDAREDARLAARTAADLAEAQVAVLERCPRCRQPVIDPADPEDEEGERWHAGCLREERNRP